jgi:hypothetical protein
MQKKGRLKLLMRIKPTEPRLTGDPFFLRKKLLPKQCKMKLKKILEHYFFAAIENLAFNEWSGPHESAFGEHIILLKEITSRILPSS